MIRSLALALLLGLAAPAGAQSLRAIDGDTVAVRGQPVRIIGMDAPELHGRCPAEIRLARQAQARLAELLAGGATVRRRGRDRYGRALAVVEDAEGRDVAQVMIAEGLARPYDGRGRRGGWC